MVAERNGEALPELLETRESKVDDVARRAAVGKATIYRRYRSKDQFVTEAVGALVDSVRVKDSFLHPSPGRRRQLDLSCPAPGRSPADPLLGDRARRGDYALRDTAVDCGA